MRRYTIKEYPDEGILLIACFPYGQQVWVITERKVRKSHKCAICKREIIKDKDKALRPLTNQGNRADRICVECSKP